MNMHVRASDRLCHACFYCYLFFFTRRYYHISVRVVILSSFLEEIIEFVFSFLFVNIMYFKMQSMT